MSNTGFKSESTGNSYKKVEKIWNDFSDDTGAFPKLNKMDKKWYWGFKWGAVGNKSQYFQYLDAE